MGYLLGLSDRCRSRMGSTAAGCERLKRRPSGDYQAMTANVTEQRRQRQSLKRGAMIATLAVGAAAGSSLIAPLLTQDRIGASWFTVTRVAALLAVGLYLADAIWQRRRARQD